MSDVAVIVASCDQFADVQPVALECIARYWPDCPWKLYTTSNNKPWGSLPILTGGEDAGWVANLSNALDHLKEPFVLTFLDDMLLCRPVDTAACRQALDRLVLWNDDSLRIGAIRLGQGAEQTEPLVDDIEDPLYRRITVASPYRISTSPTLWRVSYLRKILANCGSTAWEFETKGTELSRALPEEIWVQSGADDTNRAFRCYYTAITRGLWNRGCLDWLKQIGVEVGELQRVVIENG